MLIKPHAVTPSRYAALIALAFVLPLGLVGCGSEGGTGSDQTSDSAETSTEDGDAPDSGSDSGSATGETGDPVAMGMPEDFPADVPIVKGVVLSAQQKGSSSWSTDIKVEGNVCDFIGIQMADAGYEKFRDVALSDGCAVSYKNDVWTVSIGVGDRADAGWVAGYDFGHI